MKLSNKIFSKASAFILLFSFLGIYMINMGCVIGNFTHDLNCFTTGQEKHHFEDKAVNNKTSQNKEGDDCCKHNVNLFFASIQALIPPHIELNFTLVANNFSVVGRSIANFSTNRYLNLFIKTKPPPFSIMPKFSDTRIFIQSFQI